MEAVRLAAWILHKHPQPVTHLALQKLVFYCYGGALAFDQEQAIGLVQFEPWKHGPVSRAIWDECNQFGRQAIPPTTLGVPPVFEASLQRTLDDVLSVYGVLDAWSLREQSHLERPWIDAHAAGASSIDNGVLKRHFKSKLCGEHIEAPEYFLNAGTFTLDGVPSPVFRSFHALAEAARRSRSLS